MRLRVVFDTNVVLSALVFTSGRLAWLRERWQREDCVALLSPYTAGELTTILGYPKFHLSSIEQLDLLGDYLPFCECIEVIESCPVFCRDAKDQALLDLAHCGQADLLVTGAEDLLVLAGQTSFIIETPEAYRSRAFGTE